MTDEQKNKYSKKVETPVFTLDTSQPIEPVEPVIPSGGEQIPPKPKEENRGRHKKDCNCEKCQAKRNSQPTQPKQLTQPKQPTQSKTDDEGFEEKSLDDVIGQQPQQPNQPTQPQQPTQPEQPKVDISKYVSGALLLMLIDMFFPAMFSLAYNKFYAEKKGKPKVKSKELKLTTQEKNEIEPLADAAVKEMLFEMSPTKAFAIVLGIMYAGKLVLLTEEN